MVDYKRKVAIVGAGLFGLSIAEKLAKLNVDIDIYEKNRKILLGASGNNLNRIHQGFHYPRSISTIKQCINNYKNFIKKYKYFCQTKIKSYYLIANEKSKTNLQNFVNIANKLPFFSKIVSLDDFPLSTSHIEGGILTNEGVYDWSKMKKYFMGVLKFKNINIFYKTNILKILKNSNLVYERNDEIFKSQKYDFIIDCSYFNENAFKKNLKIPIKKKIYQKTLILEVFLKNVPQLGVAIMDGNFVSFLPKGSSKKFLIYDVKNSILKKKLSFFYPKSFNQKLLINYLNKKKLLIINNFLKYFPKVKIKKNIKFLISNRVIDINKNDTRNSKLTIFKDKFFFVSQGKTDHCIEIANRIYKKIK